MAYSVTVTSTKLIINELGIQVRFDGRDIIKATATNALIPQVNTSPREYIVQLTLTGDAAISGLPNPYIIRMSDVSNQPTWTNDTAGCNQAAADISVMIRSVASGGGGGQVDTIVPGDAIDVDSTDPVNPVVSVKYDGTTIGLNGSNELESLVDVTGFVEGPSPASSTNNNVPLWDGTTGRILKDGLAYSTGGNNAADGGKLVRFQADGNIYFSNNATTAPSISAFSTGAGDGLYGTADSGDGVMAVSVTGRGVHALAGGTEAAVHANGQSTGLALEAEQNGGVGADIALFHDGSGDGLEVKTDGGLEWTSATGAQTTADNLPVFGALTKGVVPAAGAVPAATNFLDETGNWSAPAAPTGAALTRTDDTNVTLTLGGSPSTALLAAASITAGWTGQLAISRGGTGQATQTAAFDALAPTTTKGDLIVHNGTDNIRVAVGSDGMLPFADSGATSGIEWRYYEREVDVMNGATTLTNQPNLLEILTATFPGIFITRIDLTNFTEVMLQIHVFVASASGNSPRIILGYSGSYTVVPGSYSDIGTSAVTCSMSSAGIIRSAWIPLAAGAIGDVYIAGLSNGGNNAADPQIQGVRAYFR